MSFLLHDNVSAWIVSKDKIARKEAQATFEVYGANLASITDYEKQQMITKLLQKDELFGFKCRKTQSHTFVGSATLSLLHQSRDFIVCTLLSL